MMEDVKIMFYPMQNQPTSCFEKYHMKPSSKTKMRVSSDKIPASWGPRSSSFRVMLSFPHAESANEFP